MSAVANITIHASQFPEAVRFDLLDSLRSRKVNHKFHYDSLKQTQKWLALHQLYSPSRTDPDCMAAYQRSFTATAQHLTSAGVHLIGLGCGGGQKDTALLRLMRDSGSAVFYTPSDVSVAMVLVARQSALSVLPETNCFPLVCDLTTLTDLPSLLRPGVPGSTSRNDPRSRGAPALKRLFTFFGMLPNFESDTILPRLASLVGPDDYLLLSANLAPGNDYTAGVERVLPLYDNELTRDWLMTFLLDLGIERTDGELRFGIEGQPSPVHLKRIVARFHFIRNRAFEVEAQRFEFTAGEYIRLFFSYRHTPALVRSMLHSYGLEVLDEWVTTSGEEGIFLVVNR
jgi:L-histidine N-alpha-methyltransferase